LGKIILVFFLGGNGDFFFSIYLVFPNNFLKGGDLGGKKGLYLKNKKKNPKFFFPLASFLTSLS